MLTLATLGGPKSAFEALLKVRVKLSACSRTTSSTIDTAKLFDDSPAANVSVPEVAL
jgi:hypothetical protein